MQHGVTLAEVAVARARLHVHATTPEMSRSVGRLNDPSWDVDARLLLGSTRPTEMASVVMILSYAADVWTTLLVDLRRWS